MATLLSFTKIRSSGWSNEEKAQFARIQKLLSDAGVHADVDHGLTDEGEPWCAICSGTSGDVIIHIARIDGIYLFDSEALPSTIQGRSLDDCAQRFIDDATMLSRRVQHGSTVFMHPSAMLAGMIFTIFLYLEALGDGAAHGKPLIDLDPNGPAAFGTEDLAGIEDAPEGAAPHAKASTPEDAGDPLLVLKQMLQQIAEAVQKAEGDRTGGQGMSLGQSWGTALLSSGAVVAAIAYVQDAIIGGSADGETFLLSATAEGGTEGENPAAPDLAEETGTQAQEVQDTTVFDALHTAPPVENRDAKVLPEDFLTVAQAQTLAFEARTVEPTLLVQAPVEDRFVFVDEAEAAAPREENREAVERVSADARSQTIEDVSVVSSIVRFISNSSIEIRDEILDLGDFVKVFDAERPEVTIDPVVLTAAAPLAPLAPVVPLVQPKDAIVFQPFVPRAEIASTSEIADRIADFVKITGLLGYDVTDRNSLSIYDHSIIGHEDSEDVVSRSFSFEDESTVTFFGFRDEFDLLFAA